MKKTQIIIATHKKYQMPESDVYLPLHVGAAGKGDLGYCRDDSGDNISLKNPSYCELTGLYWAWKNLTCDYLGLVHYRRYFTLKKASVIWRSGKTIQEKLKCILTEEEMKVLEESYDIIVPSKRRYVIETLYSHYSHSHYQEHLDFTRKIIEEKYPEYLPAFDKVMKSRSGYMFNMFIMKKTISDQYCEWLFDILFELEKQVDVENLSPFQGRLFGRVSEIIFNVWLLYQIEKNHYRINEIRCLYMEPVFWPKKAIAFLKAKFFNQKYDSSF